MEEQNTHPAHSLPVATSAIPSNVYRHILESLFEHIEWSNMWYEASEIGVNDGRVSLLTFEQKVQMLSLEGKRRVQRVASVLRSVSTSRLWELCQESIRMTKNAETNEEAFIPEKCPIGDQLFLYSWAYFIRNKRYWSFERRAEEKAFLESGEVDALYSSFIDAGNGIWMPFDILQLIVSFASHDYDLVQNAACVNSQFLFLVLSTWDRVVIDCSQIYDVSPLALRNAVEIGLRIPGDDVVDPQDIAYFLNEIGDRCRTFVIDAERPKAWTAIFSGISQFHATNPERTFPNVVELKCPARRSHGISSPNCLSRIFPNVERIRGSMVPGVSFFAGMENLRSVALTNSMTRAILSDDFPFLDSFILRFSMFGGHGRAMRMARANYHERLSSVTAGIARGLRSLVEGDFPLRELTFVMGGPFVTGGRRPDPSADNDELATFFEGPSVHVLESLQSLTLSRPSSELLIRVLKTPASELPALCYLHVVLTHMYPNYILTQLKPALTDAILDREGRNEDFVFVLSACLDRYFEFIEARKRFLSFGQCDTHEHSIVMNTMYWSVAADSRFCTSFPKVDVWGRSPQVVERTIDRMGFEKKLGFERTSETRALDSVERRADVEMVERQIDRELVWDTPLVRKGSTRRKFLPFRQMLVVGEEEASVVDVENFDKT